MNLMSQVHEGERISAKLCIMLEYYWNVTTVYKNQNSRVMTCKTQNINNIYNGLMWEMWDNGGEISLTIINQRGTFNIPTTASLCTLYLHDLAYRIFCVMIGRPIDWEKRFTIEEDPKFPDEILVEIF